MRSELFLCQGECGILYPLLVDRRGGTALCAACGVPARPLSQLEAMQEMQNRLTSLFADAGLGNGALGQSVNVKARVHAARELGEILRYLERSDRPLPVTGAPELVPPAVAQAAPVKTEPWDE